MGGAAVVAFACLLSWVAQTAAGDPKCPGSIPVGGFDEPVMVVPAGWGVEGVVSDLVQVNADVGVVTGDFGSRAFFATSCQPGTYSQSTYLSLSLLGKTLRYTINLSGVGCGCNAGLSLVPMTQNPTAGKCGDYYCDAMAICGVACEEINVQEAGQYAWHSTLHTSGDSNGAAAGYGGEQPAPRHFSGLQYGPGGECVDTSEPFVVEASFPVDAEGELIGMHVTLSQDGHPCKLNMTIDDYEGMPALSGVLSSGVTPVISYWGNEEMLWLDGKGADGSGPCETDVPAACAPSIAFSQFSVQPISEPVLGGAQPDLSGVQPALGGASQAAESKPETTLGGASQAAESKPETTTRVATTTSVQVVTDALGEDSPVVPSGMQTDDGAASTAFADALHCFDDLLGPEDTDYHAQCMDRNALGDGFAYVFNHWRGLVNASCGSHSECWCCRRNLTKVPPAMSWSFAVNATGCSNWRSISFVKPSVEQTASDCGSRCQQQQGCTGFGFQSSDECQVAGAQRGKCVLWFGPCERELNSCWELYDMRVESSPLLPGPSPWRGLVTTPTPHLLPGPSPWRGLVTTPAPQTAEPAGSLRGASGGGAGWKDALVAAVACVTVLAVGMGGLCLWHRQTSQTSAPAGWARCNKDSSPAPAPADTSSRAAATPGASPEGDLTPRRRRPRSPDAPGGTDAGAAAPMAAPSEGSEAPVEGGLGLEQSPTREPLNASP